MAKRKTTRRRYYPRRRARKVVRAAKRGLSRAKGRRIATGCVAAGLAGYVKTRYGSKVPHIEEIGVEATYGLAAVGLAMMTGSETAANVATGLLSVKCNEMGVEMGASGMGAPLDDDDDFAGIIEDDD